jgi:hypothetical protein
VAELDLRVGGRHRIGAQQEPSMPLTVTLGAHAQGTELSLTHGRFNRATARDEQAAGWKGCLNQLMEALE